MAIVKIPVAVVNKIAMVDCGTVAVADNNNYVLEVTFDAEWEDYTTKTARFICGSWVSEKAFTGNTVEMPMLPPDYTHVRVGFYAGDISTTSPAKIAIVGSIMSNAPSEIEAAEIERVRAEAERAEAEAQRVANENDRITAEQERVDAELARQSAEDERIANELIRIANEQERIAHGTVFIADYGRTTFAEIQSALEESKAVICRLYLRMPFGRERTYAEGVLRNTTVWQQPSDVFAFDCYPYEFRVDTNNNWTTVSMLDNAPTHNSSNLLTSGTIYNAIQGVTGAFWATYGTTTNAEVRAAIAAQKPVFVIHNNDFYRLESAADEDFVFTSIDSKGIKLSPYDVWSEFVAADTVPTEDSERLITSGGVFKGLQDKQDVLTFDDEPTEGSTNPVTSDGIYAALQTIDTDIIDPTLTHAGKAADAEVVGIKFDELTAETFIFDQTIPDADTTLWIGKNIDRNRNMVDAPGYFCRSFRVPASGWYRFIPARTYAQEAYYIYSSDTFVRANYLWSISRRDLPEDGGILLNEGEYVVGRVYSSTDCNYTAEYTLAPTVVLEPTLPLTPRQSADVTEYLKTVSDDLLADGYTHLRGTWLRNGWNTYSSADNRAYRVRYTDVVEFDRDVFIVTDVGFCVLAFYEEGGYSPLSTVLKLPKGTRAHIYMRRVDEDSSEVADIAEFSAACHISSCIADVERFTDTFTDVSMFVRVGVCGDGYAAGGGIISGITPLTWCKNLERQAGVTVDIYARSGQNVMDWVEDTTRGLPALLAAPECGLYWMQHGISGTSTAAMLGTPADMEADPKPNTFYGKYTEAIQRIQEQFPRARIVLATVTGSSTWQYQTQYKGANEAIKAIAQYCSVPCIDIVDDDFYRSLWYSDSIRLSYPTAMLAAGMAVANCRLISRCIQDNSSYFINYGSTGYPVKGKGLSTNDYTDEDKAKVDSIVPLGDVYTKTETDALLSGKQNALTFDTAPTAGSLNPVTSNGIYAALGTKVDKVTGKGLSTNDYTNADKAKVDAMPTATSDLTNDSDFQTGTEVNDAIAAALGTMTSLQYEIVTELPATGVGGTVYLMQNGLNSYDQYMWIGGQYYNLGSTAIDLSNYYTMAQVDTRLAAKQDALNFDAVPTVSSTNPVTSGGVFEALQAKQDVLTFDNTPTLNSGNPVTSEGLYLALQGKQNTLTFDGVPTALSPNPVTSAGLYTALNAKQNALIFDEQPIVNSRNPVTSSGIYAALLEKENRLTWDLTPTANSGNPVTSGGVYAALHGADIQQIINDAIGNITGFTALPVDALPAVGEVGIVYMVPSPLHPDKTDEYVWVETPEGHYEAIGTTDIDLDNYYTKTETDDLIDEVRVFEAQLNVTSAADIIQAVNDRKSIVVHMGAGSPSEFAVKAAISGEKVYLYTMTLNVGTDRSYPVFTRHVIEGTTWAVRNVGGAVTDDVPFIAEEGRTTPPQIEAATAKNRIIVVKSTSGAYYPCINVGVTADYRTRLHCLAGSYDAPTTTFGLRLIVYRFAAAFGE